MGDELEFDGHLVTIESFEGAVAPVVSVPVVSAPAPFRRPMPSIRPAMSRSVPSTPTPAPTPAMQATIPQATIPQSDPQSTESPEPQQMIPKKRIVDMSLDDDDDEDEMMDIDPPPSKEQQEPVSTPTPQQPATSAFLAPPKRVRVGLSKRTSSALHQSTHREALSTENITATPSTSIPQTLPIIQSMKDETARSNARTSGTPSTTR